MHTYIFWPRTQAQLHVSFDHGGGPRGLRGTAGQKCTGRGVPMFYSVCGGRRAPHRKPAIHEIIQRVTERGSQASAHPAEGEGRGAGWEMGDWGGALWTHSIRLHLYEYSMWIAPERPVLTGFEFLMHSLICFFLCFSSYFESLWHTFPLLFTARHWIASPAARLSSTPGPNFPDLRKTTS